ncbi:MAG: acetylxylan esterase [Verrucomicrobia bacterium]|nr:acetylxylan esterase [Verrucomicrobiota bacterium]
MATAGGMVFSRGQSPAGSSDKATIERRSSPAAEFLNRRIIDPSLPLGEVQAFLESRIPRVPDAKTAADWQKYAQELRSQIFGRVVFRGQAAAWRDAKTKVEWLDSIEGGPGYRIKKLRYEALPGLWIPALLYEPEKLSGKIPVILNVNGHDPNGKAASYKQIRCINQAKRGMLALNPEWFGMGQFSGQMSEHYRMNQLDLCGASGLAPFYLAMSRGLDLLLSLENADPERVAVTGLSGGGWQTIYISALDPRVKLCNPVAGYSSFLSRVRNLSDLGDPEQTPCDMATVADYTHLTALLAPRPALLTYNAKDDCCFASDHALPPLLAAASPIYKLFSQEGRLRSHVNYDPGTHNFERENREQLYRMLEDFFTTAKTDEDWREIPSESEVKTKEQLLVELPPENAGFHSLALDLMKSLPREAALPGDLVAAKKWQQSRRPELHQIVRTRNYTAHSERVGQEETNGVKATFWRVKLSGLWTVPVVELTRGEPKTTAILICEQGRTNATDQADRLLALGNRVLALDPFYFGESRIKSRDHLWALLVAAVGERPLGIQASQLTAIARWSQAEHQTGPVAVVAVGPRCSLSALIAAALEPHAIDGVELHGALGSLKEVIEQNWGANEKPEMFCFGLLEAFDIKQLVALAAPTPVVFPDASERVKRELADIQAWHKLFGVDYQPW